MNAKAGESIPSELHAWAPAVAAVAIARLRIDDELLVGSSRWKWVKKAGRTMRPFRDGCVELVAQAVVKQPSSVDLPGVLNVTVDVVAIDGGGANVCTVGAIRWRHRNGVSVRITKKKAA